MSGIKKGVQAWKRLSITKMGDSGLEKDVNNLKGDSGLEEVVNN